MKFDHFKLFKYKQIFLKNSNGFAMDFHSFRGKIRFQIFLIAGNININLIPICFAHRASKMAEEGERKENRECRMVYPITRPRWFIHAHATNIIASYARVDTWMGSWPSVLAIGTVDRVRPIPVDVSPPPGPELPKGVRFTIVPRCAMPRAFHRFGIPPPNNKHVYPESLSNIN